MRRVESEKAPGRRPGETGGALVEAALGLFLLAVIFLGICNLFVAANREIRTGGEESLLAATAQEQIEELKQKPFGELWLGGSLTDPMTGFHRTVEHGDGRGVLLMWEIQEASFGGMRHLSVRAVPLGGHGLTQGGPREIVLSTYRTRTFED